MAACQDHHSHSCSCSECYKVQQYIQVQKETRQNHTETELSLTADILLSALANCVSVRTGDAAKLDGFPSLLSS